MLSSTSDSYRGSCYVALLGIGRLGNSTLYPVACKIPQERVSVLSPSEVRFTFVEQFFGEIVLHT